LAKNAVCALKAL